MNTQDAHVLTEFSTQGANMNETQPHSLVLHSINSKLINFPKVHFRI